MCDFGRIIGTVTEPKGTLLVRILQVGRFLHMAYSLVDLHHVFRTLTGGNGTLFQNMDKILGIGLSEFKFMLPSSSRDQQFPLVQNLRDVERAAGLLVSIIAI